MHLSCRVAWMTFGLYFGGASPFGINGVGLCIVDTLSFEAGSLLAFF